MMTACDVAAITKPWPVQQAVSCTSQLSQLKKNVDLKFQILSITYIFRLLNWSPVNSSNKEILKETN